MDTSSFDPWWSQASYPPMPAHQTTIFDLPPDLAKVPSLSASPVSSTYDHFPGALPQEYYPQIAGEPIPFGNYPLPMTPPEFGSDHDSPRLVEPVYSHIHMSQQMSQSQPSSERQHTTSGRRRAQNRAAQRAFRERKEKHARDLEAQLSVLTDKYTKLETSYSELNAAYEKLRKTNELLTQHGDDEDDDDDGKESKRRSSNQETLRKLLEILHGDVKSIQIKSEIS